ncbi:hypothetical protein ACFWIX_14105 [Pseudarthrobacter sp. NPDC058362]|uniref:DoxX family protein n=1 Tax=Pseudarthrobacter sp. NPDC058362 TaxID=3346458 RepID=UPI0036652BE3
MLFPRSRRAARSLPGDARNLSAPAMSALLLASAWHHFRSPRFYHQVVPSFLCREDAPAPGETTKAAHDAGAPRSANRPLAVLTREEWIAVSGLLELAGAVGILLPPTRKAAAAALTAMFTAFLAGHVDALRRAYGPRGTPLQRRIHTLRLPLQAPLIAWAWSLRKPGGTRAGGVRP